MIIIQGIHPSATRRSMTCKTYKPLVIMDLRQIWLASA